jgi:Peptidase family M23
VALPLLLAWVLAGTAQARPDGAPPERIIFPVVGQVQYTDDFGDPRGQGSHEGNDILADRGAPAVAAEAGRIKIWTSSSRAGCMLYLYGKSGTTYLYIHLNNDLTAENDNRGQCKPGIAYAPGLEDGERVSAGELIGYVGNSGDADGASPHLHFELHPGDGGAVSPYAWLRRAEKLLFAVPENEIATATADAVTLSLVGTVAAAELGGPGAAARTTGEPPPPPPPPPEQTGTAPGDGGGAQGDPEQPEPADPLALLTIRVTKVRLSSGDSWNVTRRVALQVTANTVVERALEAKEAELGLDNLAPGDKVTVTTTPVELTLPTQRARPGVLLAARVLLRA